MPCFLAFQGNLLLTEWNEVLDQMNYLSNQGCQSRLAPWWKTWVGEDELFGIMPTYFQHEPGSNVSGSSNTLGFTQTLWFNSVVNPAGL